MSARIPACLLLTILFGCSRQPEIIIIPVSAPAVSAQPLATQPVATPEVEAVVEVQSLHSGALRDRVLEIGGRPPTRTGSDAPKPEEAAESQHPLADREASNRPVSAKPVQRKIQRLK